MCTLAERCAPECKKDSSSSSSSSSSISISISISNSNRSSSNKSSSSAAAAQQRRRRQPNRATGQRVRHRRGSGGALTCQLRRRPGSSAAQAAAAFLCRAIFASGGGPRRRAQGMAQGRGAKAHRRVPGPAIPPSLLEPSCSRRPPAARPVMHRRPGAHCGACRQVRPGGGINVSRPLRLPSDCVRRTWASPRLS